MSSSIPHPLVYAVIEVRVPFAPRLGRAETAESLQGEFSDLPILRSEKRQRVSQIGNNIEVGFEDAWRFIDLQSSKSLILSNTAIVYETTRYPGFEIFLREFRDCLTSIASAVKPAGYERIGLRYVNEVWPNEVIDSVESWKMWISPELVETLNKSEGQVLSGLDAEDSHLKDLDVNLQFALKGNRGLTTRIATQNGTGVVGNAPLKRWTTPEKAGSFCIIDFDGYWPLDQGSVELFDQDAICDKLDSVHRPVKGGFRWATTAELRRRADINDNY